MRNVVPQQFTSGGGGGDAPHVLRQHSPDLRRLDEKIHFGNQLRVDDSRGALEKRQDNRGLIASNPHLLLPVACPETLFGGDHRQP
jgi:hypothetical protein